MDIQKDIVTAIKSGGVVILPADTVYGMFCLASDKKAVKKIYKIKGRDFKKPLQVFLPDVKSVLKYAVIPAGQKKAVKKFLPGPYTLVLKLKPLMRKKFSFLKTGTIGVRVIKSKILGPILSKTGPLAATSANLSGKKTPVKFGDIDFKLRAGVNMSVIYDGAVGGKASKVVDLTGPKPVILRP